MFNWNGSDWPAGLLLETGMLVELLLVGPLVSQEGVCEDGRVGGAGGGAVVWGVDPNSQEGPPTGGGVMEETGAETKLGALVGLGIGGAGPTVEGGTSLKPEKGDLERPLKGPRLTREGIKLEGSDSCFFSICEGTNDATDGGGLEDSPVTGIAVFPGKTDIGATSEAEGLEKGLPLLPGGGPFEMEGEGRGTGFPGPPNQEGGGLGWKAMVGFVRGGWLRVGATWEPTVSQEGFAEKVLG